MSYASYLNSPFYVSPTGTTVPTNVQDFYNSTEVQAYLNNNPTTSYTLTNLYNDQVSNPPVTYYGQTIPANDAFQYIQIIQSVYDADPDNVDILDVTIPAGTYNVSYNAGICTGNPVNSYIDYARIVLYNRAGGDADANCPEPILSSSSGNSYNYVADANVLILIRGMQRVTLTADTVVSMALQTSKVSNTGYMLFEGGDVIQTASFTFTPTI